MFFIRQVLSGKTMVLITRVRNRKKYFWVGVKGVGV